jgi:Tol biopolymer transport system component/DNA-binding winged helix-turn-helix (wHTH) protein
VGNGNGSSTGNVRARRFGTYELDLRARELRRDGVKLKLQEQPFQVLSLLLEKPGEVVTRDDLRSRLWPADTFVDFDHSLNAAIKRLRDALGDNAENPTFIGTVARRGYRFLAPVGVVPVNGDSDAGPQPVTVARDTLRLRNRWIATGVGAIILVLVGLAIGLFVSPREPLPVRVTRLTANPVGDPVRAAVISHDGRYLAFSDETGFYVRQIDTDETHAMVLPEGLRLSALSWFPDNLHMIVALAGEGHGSGLWEVSAFGGSARKLVDVGEAPAVSPDGKEIAFIAGRKMRQRIWIMNVDGSQPHELVGQDGDLFGAIAWSPDSKRVAFTTARFVYGYGAKAAIAVIDVQRTAAEGVLLEPVAVLWLFGLEAPLAWTADDRIVYGLSEPRPRQFDSNLWSVRLNKNLQPQRAPARLTNDAGSVLSVSASGDAKRIVYVKGVPESDVYVANLDSSGSISEPQRLTLDDRQDMPFDWTADGKQVIFASDRTGAYNIYKQAPDQAVPDVLVGGNQQFAEPRLSPDGSQLIYTVYANWADSSSTYEVPLMRVPLAGGPPQQITKANFISNHQCARAPAIVCLYSVVHDNDVKFFTFDPLRGPGKQVLELKDVLPELYNWTLSPDGTTLAIAKGKWGEEEGGIHLISLTGGADRWLTVQGWAGLASLDWAADSKGIWGASADGDENALLYIDLLGNARVVWRPKKLTVGWAIPSRDGKALALHVRSNSANAWMLERP